MPVTMGLGVLSDSNTVFKRKFRWTFILGDAQFSSDGVITDPTYENTTGHFCKISARPSITFAEQEVQHVIEIINLPSKAQWDPISVTVYDIEKDDYIYRWLISFYNPYTGIVRPMAEPINTTSQPKKSGFLRLLNGHGTTIEFWKLEGCYPITINWGDLDYESSDLATIEMQLRYDRAILQDPNGNPITNPLGS